ncbi:hypothetical protein ACFV4K_30915 [Nocardia sp. NPDC059764]
MVSGVTVRRRPYMGDGTGNIKPHIMRNMSVIICQIMIITS